MHLVFGLVGSTRFPISFGHTVRSSFLALQVEAGSTDVVKDASVEAEAALGFQEDTTADPLKATEAPVEATTTAEGAGEGAESAAKPIYLAGPWASTGCSVCV